MGMERKPFTVSEEEKALLELLREHPELEGPVKGILNAANREGIGANEVEDELIKAVRRLGQETLRSWANRRARRIEEDMEERNPPMHRHKKKR